MSREEAITEFEFAKDMILFNPTTGETLTLDYVESVNDDNVRLYKACDKAISDMTKLQKIEDALGRDCLSDDMEKCNFDGLCDAHTVSVIEHILRGE